MQVINETKSAVKRNLNAGFMVNAGMTALFGAIFLTGTAIAARKLGFGGLAKVVK